jgi:hypothetical protein
LNFAQTHNHRLHRREKATRGKPDGGDEVSGDGLQTRPRAITSLQPLLYAFEVFASVNNI